jgi:hypothetical protein
MAYVWNHWSEHRHTSTLLHQLGPQTSEIQFYNKTFINFILMYLNDIYHISV